MLASENNNDRQLTCTESADDLVLRLEAQAVAANIEIQGLRDERSALQNKKELLMWDIESLKKTHKAQKNEIKQLTNENDKLRRAISKCIGLSRLTESAPNSRQWWKHNRRYLQKWQCQVWKIWWAALKTDCNCWFLIRSSRWSATRGIHDCKAQKACRIEAGPSHLHPERATTTPTRRPYCWWPVWSTGVQCDAPTRAHDMVRTNCRAAT